MKRSFLVTFVTFAVGGLAIPMELSYAQDTRNVLIEEITVTARKTEENLSSVPIAVSAFSGEQLDALGVENSGDIALAIPNLTWNTEFGRASPQVYMRGVGSNNFAPTNQGPVAIYQDGVIIAPNIVQGFAAFDLQRLEALKGPQGTLFGRNSTGGLINFISRKPTIDGGTNGYVRFDAGDWGTFNIEGAVSFDLSDQWAARVAAVINNSDGEFDNLNPAADSEAGGTSDHSFRGQLLFDNGGKLKVLFNVHRSFADPDVTPFKVAGTFGPASCATNIVFGQCETAFGYTDSPDLHTTRHQDDEEEVENTGAYLNIEYDINDDIQLTSITSYDDASIARLDDVDESPASDEFDHYNEEFEWISQEVRFSGGSDFVQWHAGAFYLREESEGILVFDFPTDESVYGPGTGFGVGNFKKIETTSFAIFAQGVWNVSDRSRVTAGLRWTTEEKDIPFYIGFLNRTDPGQDTIYSGFNDIDTSPAGAIAFNVSRNSESDNVSGRLSYDFQLTDDVLVYASFARGFKGGDVNGVATFDPIATEIVNPETIDSYEIGLKGTFADGKLRLNAAAFFMDYQDQQQAVILPGGTAAGEPAFQNAAGSELPGFEVDVTWAATDNLTLVGSFGYVDATYDSFDIDGPDDFSGNRIPLVSDTEVFGMAQYAFPLASGAELTFQVDASFQSEQFFTPQNNLFPEVAVLFEDDLTLFNASVKFASASQNWYAKLYARNLADEQYLVSGFGIGGFISSAKPGPGRYIGAVLNYEFGQ